MSPFQISFEFFPPKTAASISQLMQTAHALTVFKPEFFSVTYGAGGSTREGTTNTLLILQKETNTMVAPHVSCIGAMRETIIDVLAQYQSLGVKRLVALRGDLPSGMGEIGDIQYAAELVRLIRATSGDHFHIEVAAYPDIHPQAKNAKQDIINLKNKIDAGANSAITQYFYNADAYFRLLEECEKNHIHVPIVPGIMPILQYNKLLHFSENCGADIPRWMRKHFDNFADDVESLQAFGLEVVQHLCEQLIKGGVKQFHFYTLNRHELCVKLLSLLKINNHDVNVISTEKIV